MLEKIRSIGNVEETLKDGALPSLLDSFGSCAECIKGKLIKTKRKVSKCSLYLLEIIHTDFMDLFLMPL